MLHEHLWNPFHLFFLSDLWFLFRSWDRIAMAVALESPSVLGPWKLDPLNGLVGVWPHGPLSPYIAPSPGWMELDWIQSIRMLSLQSRDEFFRNHSFYRRFKADFRKGLHCYKKVSLAIWKIDHCEVLWSATDFLRIDYSMLSRGWLKFPFTNLPFIDLVGGLEHFFPIYWE